METLLVNALFALGGAIVVWLLLLFLMYNLGEDLEEDIDGDLRS